MPWVNLTTYEFQNKIQSCRHNQLKMVRYLLAILALIALVPVALAATDRPNVIVVFIDDMGWGDFSCFGNDNAATPHIDRLAKEGVRFEQFYVNSPICSPSRTALSTGQYPQRWRITSFLNDRLSNEQRGMAQWLDPDAPMLARFLQKSGYATRHFRKWHLGGQRDVNDAPPITEYGFDTSLTNFEGMGPKLLPLTLKPGEKEPGHIWSDAESLGEGYRWMQRSEITGGFVDAAIPFMDQAVEAGKPFYLNLWPDDVHSPFWPPVAQWGDGSKRELYLAVLESMDKQLGRLFDHIRNDADLKNNTLVLVCSDNGPERAAGESGPFRGFKTYLYEGGIRVPACVRWPAKIRAGRKSDFVCGYIDLLPTLVSLAGGDASRLSVKPVDGVDLSGTLVGETQEGVGRPWFSYNGQNGEEAEHLAVIDDGWKLKVNGPRLTSIEQLKDGSRQIELFQISKDPFEEKDLKDSRSDLVANLGAMLVTHRALQPERSVPRYREGMRGFIPPKNWKLNPETPNKLVGRYKK